MKLHDSLLRGLADMVVGDNPLFPRRSSYFITQFFRRCGLPFVHDGSTRARWVTERLAEINIGVSSKMDLPSDELVSVFTGLFDPFEFDAEKLEMVPALEAFNQLLKRTGLAGSLDGTGNLRLTNTGSGINSSLRQRPQPLLPEEIARRAKLEKFLDEASEDELLERMLAPYFTRLGFHRVSVAGHKDKSLEFGKDLWMKYRLPTGHWIYFCAQAKRDKIDSSATGKGNVATILNQALMAIGHEVFDPDINRGVLLDHIYIISAGEITKAARAWLAGQLDAQKRRHVIFMDRAEFLDNAAKILVDLKLEDEPAPGLGNLTDDDIPF